MRSNRSVTNKFFIRSIYNQIYFHSESSKMLVNIDCLYCQITVDVSWISLMFIRFMVFMRLMVKSDGLGWNYWRSVSSSLWFDGSVNGDVYLEKLLKSTVSQNVKMLQQEKNIGLNKMEQAACNSCDQNLEIESSLRTLNIIFHHIRPIFHHCTIHFGVNVRNLWGLRSPRTYVIFDGASQDLRRR